MEEWGGTHTGGSDVCGGTSRGGKEAEEGECLPRASSEQMLPAQVALETAEVPITGEMSLRN